MGLTSCLDNPTKRKLPFRESNPGNQAHRPVTSWTTQTPVLVYGNKKLLKSWMNIDCRRKPRDRLHVSYRRQRSCYGRFDWTRMAKTTCNHATCQSNRILLTGRSPPTVPSGTSWSGYEMCENEVGENFLFACVREEKYREVFSCLWTWKRLSTRFEEKDILEGNRVFYGNIVKWLGFSSQ